MEVTYFLSKYDPDALRFYLTATLPETALRQPAPLFKKPDESVIEEEYAPRLSSCGADHDCMPALAPLAAVVVATYSAVDG